MNQWRNNLAGPFTTFILTPHAPQTTTRFLCSLSSKIPLGTVSTHYLLFFPLCLLAVSEHSWPWSSTSSPYLVPPSGPHVCATDLMIFLLPCDSLCLHSFHLCVQKSRYGVNWCFGHLQETLREPTDGDMKLFVPPNELEDRGDEFVWMCVSKDPRKLNMLDRHNASQR